MVVGETSGFSTRHTNQEGEFWGKCSSRRVQYLVLATREMFARVCSRKMMGPSHASDFLATTKVRIQLWSFLNRCMGQSSQRGYNRWGKGHKNPPVQPTIHWMPIMTPCGTTDGQTQPAPTSVPSSGCPWWLSVLWQFLLSKAASISALSTVCPLWICCRWTSTRVSIWFHRGNPFCKKWIPYLFLLSRIW